jgi:nitrile hydratase
MVREPRTLLAEMGCSVPDGCEIRVWDSSAEVRYLVLPMRPSGTDALSEIELADLVTRDDMIGVART